MRFLIEKYDGYTQAAWNGTIEDLEGFKVKVTNNQTAGTYWGKVVNGKAVALNRHSVLMVRNALNQVREMGA